MRPLRNFIPGLPVHLVHRGNNRQQIFTCTGDFLLFRRVIEDAFGELEVRVHSYVLMTNHVHLLLTPQGEHDISRALQTAIRRYTGYFNKRYSRTGFLWDSRAHATVIEEDRYLLACHRYIDMNPVRAGLVERAGEYLWSSHNYYAKAEPDSLLTPHNVVRALAVDDHARALAYRALFETPLDPQTLGAIRQATRSCRKLGWSNLRGRGRPRKIVSDTIYSTASGNPGAGDGAQL